MIAFEHKTQVFIVRIWCEPREIEGAHGEWRGYLEHVHSGERRYVKSLQEITAVIDAILQKIKVGSGPKSTPIESR